MKNFVKEILSNHVKPITHHLVALTIFTFVIMPGVPLLEPISVEITEIIEVIINPQTEGNEVPLLGEMGMSDQFLAIPIRDDGNIMQVRIGQS